MVDFNTGDCTTLYNVKACRRGVCAKSKLICGVVPEEVRVVLSKVSSTVDEDKEMGWKISDLKRELTDLKSQKTKLKRNQSIAEPTLERELEKLDRKIEAVNERLDKLTETRVP